MRRRINVKTNDDTISAPSGHGFFLPPEVDIEDRNSHTGFCLENIRIRPGVRLLVANNFQGRQFHMDFEIDRAPVSFSFTLSGRMRCTIKHGWRSKTVAERSPGDAVLAYLPQTSGTVEIFTGGHAGGVSLHFSLPAFNGLFPSLPQPLEHLAAGTGGPWKCGPVYHQSRFGAETLHVLQQILQCPYAGDIRRLFFEAKVLELVALEMAHGHSSETTQPSNFGRRDIDRVKEAYHILLTRLDAPPSLVDLSRIVGLNRNKLNCGFKRLYGDTAFNLLRQARLAKALSLLEDSDINLSEIALSVGYNSQANFTTAFRRRYGHTPKTVRRERNSGR